MSGNPTPLTLAQPLDIDDAREASRRLSTQRREAERTLETLTRDAAEKEAEYRKALAIAFVTAVGTAAEREALARADVAEKSMARDISAGMVKVQAERLRGLEGERSMLKSLIDWSSRINEEPREQAARYATA
jgi:hypothetical protein